MQARIESFDGEHRFLSNFWPAVVFLNDTAFRSVEHAYQAAKSTDVEERLRIRACDTPGQAKRLGRRIVFMDPHWDLVKLNVMRGLVSQKFMSGFELGRRLLATGDAELIEGNRWGDTFWGVCGGVGQNHLGRILMDVREGLRRAE